MKRALVAISHHEGRILSRESYGMMKLWVSGGCKFEFLRRAEGSSLLQQNLVPFVDFFKPDLDIAGPR
jgi:hypothetical protein